MCVILLFSMETSNISSYSRRMEMLYLVSFCPLKSKIILECLDLKQFHKMQYIFVFHAIRVHLHPDVNNHS